MEHNKTVIGEIESYCLQHLGAYEARPFGTYPICYKVRGKLFVQFNPEEHFYKLTLKCQPEKANIYRQIYSGIVVRGYHCPPVQQPYWNTVDLKEFVDLEMLFQMIDEAYDALVQGFSKKAKMELQNVSQMDYMDTDGTNKDFKLLCQNLDQALNDSVGGRIQRIQYEKYNLLDSIHDVIVAYDKGVPIACGAYKMFDEDHVELKRIFVSPEYRNMGLGAEVVRRLEAKAKIQGFHWCILETGAALKAAQHTYKKAGYKIIPNFGQYADMPGSICMERKI